MSSFAPSSSEQSPEARKDPNRFLARSVDLWQSPVAPVVRKATQVLFVASWIKKKSGAQGEKINKSKTKDAKSLG